MIYGGYCITCENIKTLKEVLKLIDEINKDLYDSDWGNEVNPLEVLKQKIIGK